MGWSGTACVALFLDELPEPLVEAGQASAPVEQVLLTAGPGRMGGRIDVKRQLAVGFAPGCAGPIGGAVVQHHIDEMIIGMDALFHRKRPSSGSGLYKGSILPRQVARVSIRPSRQPS